MSAPALISPLLDGFVMGDPISKHHGVCCCPAMELATEDKYIVKIISVPASQVQLDALLLTGAYSSSEDALAYFSQLTENICQEAALLQRLSGLEGFVGYNKWQIVPMEDETGFDIYLLSPYRSTLERHFRQGPMTHLGAVNLGLDLCSALTVARRSGNLYVDLKPANIFVTDNNEYRIGDLGFIELSSLKYASLPEKYHSSYTAPEVTDAFSALNDTMDIYALGLILYQAYNNNTLPFEGFAPNVALEPPAYADYEMAEIILKACAPDPADRWQDPVQLGQALVSYMQRNTVNDTLIIPPSVPDSLNEEETEPEELPEAESEIEPAEEPAAETEEVEEAEQETDTEQFMLDGFPADETAPTEETVDELEDSPVSEEVSEMLATADELIAHELPAPAVAPEPVPVLLPPQILEEEETEEEPETEPEESEEPQAEEEESEQIEIAEVFEPEEGSVALMDEELPPANTVRRRYTGLIVALSAILVLLLLAIGGLFFYENYYLQTIDNMTLSGEENRLTVTLDTQTDNELLTVICKDTYGNSIPQQVVNNQAVFENLRPGTKYTVTLQIEGFHQLVGTTASSYTTPAQTNIVSFSAVTGDQDGTVILNFSVQGPENTAWRIAYSAPGIEEKLMPCTSHMAVITGLEVGVTYTFRLVSVADLYIVGTDTLEHTVSKVVYPQNLQILGFEGDALKVTWDAPADTVVESWTVRCYNTDGYDNTITVTEPGALLSGLDITKGYTVDVKAAGMSESEQVTVSPNSVTVTEITLDDSVAGQLTMNWSFLGTTPNAWRVLYSIDGSSDQVLITEEAGCTIAPLVPGGHYAIRLELADGTNLYGGTVEFNAPAAANFSSYKLTNDNLTISMTPTPKDTRWDPSKVAKKDFKTTYSAGQLASFVVKSSRTPGTSKDTVTTMFVIRDGNGVPVSVNAHDRVWNDMWSNRYCKIEMPFMPETAGSYTAEIYWDGALVHTQSFTVQ